MLISTQVKVVLRAKCQYQANLVTVKICVSEEMLKKKAMDQSQEMRRNPEDKVFGIISKV